MACAKSLITNSTLPSIPLTEQHFCAVNTALLLISVALKNKRFFISLSQLF